MKQVNIIICLGLVMLLHLCGCQREEPILITEDATSVTAEDRVSESTITQNTQAKEHKPEEVCVYVCGAVVQSGVYTLPEGSRVYEAIAAAGGLADNADEYYVNQAEALTDGMQITVPFAGEVSVWSGESGVAQDGKINLNYATKEELQTLNGIGEVRAEAIIAYREAHGSFNSIEDITKVDGISEKLYEKIKEQIVV